MQYTAVTSYLKENMPFLKDVFLELAVNSSYPFVSVLELSVFCQTCDLFDNVFKTAHNDLLFISANAQQKGNIKNKSGLIRCEFLEFLVRVCDFKYIQTGIHKTFAESIKYLVNDKIKPHFELQGWQAFRDRELWCNPVDAVLKTNIDSLKKLHNLYAKPDHMYMNLKDVMRLLMKDSGL